jgi:general secretion pathway protein K
VKKQKGMVLLMVLLIFSVAVVLATSMIERQSIDIERSATLHIQQQARAFAYGAESAVRQGLYMDWEADKEKDHAGEEWAVDRTFPLDPGVINIQISDLQGRFNLNSLQPGSAAPTQEARFRNLLNLLGLNTEFASRWKAWLDKDSQADDEYYTHEPSYRAAYAACRHTSELMLITDLDLESYQKLEPYITCLPASAQLNVNTASAMVLASLDSEFSLADAQQVVAARGEEGFASVDDFWNLSQVEKFTREVSGGDPDDENAPASAWAKTDFSVATEYFGMFARIDIDERIATVEAGIMRARDTGMMTTYYRDFSRREARSIPAANE